MITPGGPPRLRTRRLLLREFRLEDLDALYSYRSHPDWARFLPLEVLPRPYTRTHAEADLAEYLAFAPADHPFWAIEHEGVLVGNIDAEREDDSGRASALIGWGIARHLWGRGLTTEAATAVVDWCFEAWPVAGVRATTRADNVGSWRVMEKLGMHREARLRRQRNDQDTTGDEVRYGLRRSVWAARSRPSS